MKTVEATWIKTENRPGDEAGPIAINTVTVNGIMLEIVKHGYGGVIRQVGRPGIVYTRKDGRTYRGVYSDEWELKEEIEIPELPGHWFHEAARLACMKPEQGKTITITTDRAESSYGQPVVLVDGKITDLHNYLTQVV